MIKKFEPAYTMTRTESVGYEVPILETFTYTYPDRWAIYIKEFDGGFEEWLIAVYYVKSEEIYNSIEIGSTFKYSEDVCYKGEPHTKEAA